MNKDKKAERMQIKKDKARLKELRKLEKQNALSDDETWEFSSLLNANTERRERLTKKLYIVSSIIQIINLVVLIAWIICVLIR